MDIRVLVFNSGTFKRKELSKMSEQELWQLWEKDDDQAQVQMYFLDEFSCAFNDEEVSCQDWLYFVDYDNVKKEDAENDPLVREVATAKQAEVRQENAHKQGLIGETIAMLTAQVWGEIYNKMREPDCTQLSCAIRDAAYRFEKKWNETPSEQREGYYIDMIDEFAKELITEFKAMYC